MNTATTYSLGVREHAVRMVREHQDDAWLAEAGDLLDCGENRLHG